MGFEENEQEMNGIVANETGYRRDAVEWYETEWLMRCNESM